MVARRLRSSFSASTLTRLRQMPACDALALLATHVKPDPTYLPVKDDQQPALAPSTRPRRFRDRDHGSQVVRHACARGGGGAIDLAMHLLDVSFVDAVKLLNRKARPMVQIIRKASLPTPDEVTERSALAAAERATDVAVREPRPAGFPLLFTKHWQLIEPAVAFLHEHSVQRAHTDDTLRTYAEILYDWFETLEQNDIPWESADAVDLVAYRNRMMAQPSPHTGRPYRTTTINHRVRGVLRFYEWAVRTQWLNASPLADKTRDFRLARHHRPTRASHAPTHERSLFVLRQYEPLPRPLVSEQARELLAELAPPYDLMARWQLYTGLRISELLRLGVSDIGRPALRQPRCITPSRSFARAASPAT
jgi:hypothetical protein